MGWYTSLTLLCAAVAAAAIFSPGLPLEQSQGVGLPLIPLLRLLHLAGFSIAFGTKVWITFVAGVVLFRSLPRHQFGEVQSRLFPPYFRLVAVACSLSLAAFALLQRNKDSPALPSLHLQLAALAVPALAALANLLFLEPLTSKIMRERHRIEKEAGIGMEVGLSRNREVAKTNPELRAVNKRFGAAHGVSSLLNLVGLMALGAHLYYISARV